jgi:TPR repeat protein
MLSDGIDAFRSGRYADAYALLYPVARSGNADAKYLVGQILDQGLAGETAPDKALQMLIDAARLGQKDAKVLVERTKRCGAEQTCDGGEAVEIWTCGGRRIRMAPLADFACDRGEQNGQPVHTLIDRGKSIDAAVYRNFGDPLPGGHAAGQFGSAQECAAWAAAAGPNERRRCHQHLK